MKFFSRRIEKTVFSAARGFPALVMTGPRRTGKTTILRRLYPKARYILLEDPDIQKRVRSDPRGFLEELTPPILFDEIQNVPELFDYIRTLIDKSPRKMGQWLFTGSQEAPLMQGVSESMAGRAAILQLLPLSLAETDKVNVLLGGYPEVLARPAARNLWFSSYLQTYLERDVRSIANIRDLGVFRRFLAFLAARHGQILNRSDLGAALGVSVPTINQWLHILEVTGQVMLVSPYFENFGKRLIKSPKVYIGDSGLACHLLGIQSKEELSRSPFLGALFEGLVASEILKSQINQGLRKELYYFRDHQGLEVDFLFPGKGGALHMVECKASKTIHPAMASPMNSLFNAMRNTTGVKRTVVHMAAKTGPDTRAIFPGVDALNVNRFVEILN